MAVVVETNQTTAFGYGKIEAEQGGRGRQQVGAQAVAHGAGQDVRIVAERYTPGILHGHADVGQAQMGGWPDGMLQWPVNHLPRCGRRGGRWVSSMSLAVAARFDGDFLPSSRGE